MIVTEKEFEKLMNDFGMAYDGKPSATDFYQFITQLKSLVRQVRTERNIILDYAVKSCQELVIEQDGIDLGYNENKRLILETLKLEPDK